MNEAAFLLITFVVGVSVGGVFMHTLTIGRYGEGYQAGYASGKHAGRAEGLRERRSARRAAVGAPDFEETASG